jgi:hypothetical protein
MGSNGPVSNPAGIRYLPPEGFPGLSQAAVSPAGLPDLSVFMGAAQVANLGLAAVNVALSVEAIRRLGRIEEKLDRVSLGVMQANEKLDRLLVVVDRINLSVAEDRLRQELTYLLKDAWSDGHVNLERLEELGPAIERFEAAVEAGGYGSLPKIELATDVRDMLFSALRVLRGARLIVWRECNAWMGSDPDWCLTEALVGHSHAELASQVMAVRGVQKSILEASSKVADPAGDVPFGGTKAFKSVKAKVEGHLYKQATRSLAESMPVAVQVASVIDAHPLMRKDAATVETVTDYLDGWLARTDAGLIWRLKQELSLRGPDGDWWRALLEAMPVLESMDASGILSSLDAAPEALDRLEASVAVPPPRPR